MHRLFRTNEHPIDRLLRIILGLSILSLTILGPRTLWGLVGVVPLITGIVGYCPLYSILGINTCPVNNQPIATRS
jgi:hypothetical protein